jgi:hypothetical protein
MRKPNWVSSFMEEPPASTHQSTNGCKNPKLTVSRMNLQHFTHKKINGRKHPKIEFLQIWTSIRPQENYSMKKIPNEVSSILDEPPAPQPKEQHSGWKKS